jgi:predicted nucleotidyltransferase
MFRKTHGVAAQLREALGPLDRKIELALVFGSVARGEQSPGSDLDLLVVGSPSFASLVKALRPAQDALAREINPVLYTREEFELRLARGDGLLKNILGRPIIFITGDRDDLGKLGGDPAAAGTHR